jgi:hypothetical protein
MPSGWTRLLFENFEFPFEVVFPPDLDAGNLRAKYDVLVFNDSGLPAAAGGGGRGGRGGAGAGGDAPEAGGRGGRGGGGGQAQRDPADTRPAPMPLPQEYERRRGSVTAKTLASIEQFVREGGTVIAIGGAAPGAISLFKLPLRPHVTAGREKFYVPGSVLRVAVDPKNPVAHGYGNEVDIFFDNSPVWSLDSSAANASSIHPVAWFNSRTPLRSGWAWGQELLDKGIQMAETRVDKGRVFLFGNELIFRTQPHGNYRFFFNALYLSVAQ